MEYHTLQFFLLFLGNLEIQVTAQPYLILRNTVRLLYGFDHFKHIRPYIIYTRIR